MCLIITILIAACAQNVPPAVARTQSCRRWRYSPTARSITAWLGAAHY